MKVDTELAKPALFTSKYPKVSLENIFVLHAIGWKNLVALLIMVLHAGIFSSAHAQDKPGMMTPVFEKADSAQNAVSRFQCGTDIRFRHESIENPYLIDADPPGHIYHFERLRIREWNTLSPCSELEFNVRFTWEGKHYWMPVSKAEWDKSEIVFDNLSGKFRFGALAAVTVGRQDIVFGDGWLVFDGTPLDGPRTSYFDAVRATIDINNTGSTLDLIYIDQTSNSNSRLAPVFSKHIAVMEQDERGAIINFSCRLNRHTRMEPYFIFKHDKAVLSKGDNGDVYTIGSRFDHTTGNNLTFHAEGAYQFGSRLNTALFPTQSGSLSAFGVNSRFTYAFKDPMNSEAWLGYMVLSGNDAQSPRNQQFDPLWGRWAQYSELFPNDLDRPGDRNNLKRFNFGFQFEPLTGMVVQSNYQVLFAYANRFSGVIGFSDESKFKGHLFTSFIRYRYNRIWSGLILGEYFIPGGFYKTPSVSSALHTRNDPAAFLRLQIVCTFENMLTGVQK
ncbi:MAG: alginate export family protein [Ignavibacteriales bacterium]|nr:alginate export family protein [Ignavibacteriales bacterium]